MEQVLDVGRVFVAGGRPTVTYYPREQLQLEARVREYLSDRYSILSVSGATKTGKTVLLRTNVPDGIWLSGGTIASVDDFWDAVADHLGLYTEQQTQTTTCDTETRTSKGGGTIGVVSGDYTKADGTVSGRLHGLGRSRSKQQAARATLAGRLHVVVIDDFHYIDQGVQLQIVRNLKDLVFDGLGVIVAAVPHRAYDVVRVEKEMTGRVVQLEVGFWDLAELREIAAAGFRALNVVDEEGKLAARLADESFRSPHLMQEFCKRLCRMNGVERTVEGSPVTLREPSDWNDFFRQSASAASKSAFDLLARGPRQRSDRKVRTLRSGRETDIYGAVLAGIASTGPLTQITYEQLRGALRDVMRSEPPQRHEITRVLEEMATIAKKQLEGEPVVDYDEELATLHISDPYFAFYLRWGAREL